LRPSLVPFSISEYADDLLRLNFIAQYTPERDRKQAHQSISAAWTISALSIGQLALGWGRPTAF
jgi:hypothetical protein